MLQFPMRYRCLAFTLVELLTVIAIVGILGAIVMTATGRARVAAERARSVSNLRQIGTAAMSYANENRGRLPGPLAPPQGAVYDPGVPGQLATILGDYFDVSPDQAPAIVPVFLSPAVEDAMAGTPPEQIRPFLANVPPPGPQAPPSPWGNLREPGVAPASLAQIDPDMWGLMETDQENPLVAGRPFAAHTPPRPLHGDERLAWYFDGSVLGLTNAELESGPPGGGPGGGGPGGGGRGGGGGPPR